MSSFNPKYNNKIGGIYIGSIYLITNEITGSKYVGQTKNSVERRFTEHKRDAKKHAYNSLLHSAMRKYGFENFSIRTLEDNIPLEKLNEKEIEWIEKENTFIDSGKGYNLTKGGCQNYQISEETRQKHRENALNGITGHSHIPRNQVYTKEVREKMSRNRRNKKMPEEAKKKISDKMKGRKLSSQTKEKLREINLGRHHTEETKEKISKSKKEYLKDKTHHNFYGKKGNQSSRHVEVLQYDKNWNFIQEFGCKLEVLDFLGVKGHTQLNNAIKNKTLYKNYYWVKKDVETIESYISKNNSIEDKVNEITRSE